jgi:ribosome-binding protein aMBF1 (putative translation factor)
MEEPAPQDDAELALLDSTKRATKRRAPRKPDAQAIHIWELRQRGIPVRKIAEKIGLDRTHCHRLIQHVDKWRAHCLFSKDLEQSRRQIVTGLLSFADLVARDYVSTRRPTKTTRTTTDEEGKESVTITEEPGKPNAQLAMAYAKLTSELRATLGMDSKTLDIRKSVNVLHRLELDKLPPETAASLTAAARKLRTIDVTPQDESDAPASVDSDASSQATGNGDSPA